MKHDAKVNVQPENTAKQQVRKHPVKSQEIASPDLANLTQTGLQHLPADDVVRWSEMVGNREVTRLMTQRQDEEEDETIPGPRMKSPRENAGQLRSGAGLEVSPDQRGLELETGNIGDAFNLDGQGCYGWDRTMSADDVANVVNALLGNQSSDNPGKNIYIFSGHHGTERGNLVGPVPEFFAEDQATATNAMSNNPGTQIEVIDDPSTYPSKASMVPAFNSTGVIRILAWCFSKRSYDNQGNLKANWWPEPDHINLQP